MTLEGHLAEHLESISLFVLPTEAEKSNTNSEDADVGESSSRMIESSNSDGWVDEELLEEEHPDTPTSVNNLPAVPQEQGKYDEAEQAPQELDSGRDDRSRYYKLLQLRKETRERREYFKFENPVDFDYAEYLQRQEEHVESRMIESSNSDGWVDKELLEEEHHDTPTSVNNFPSVLHEQRKYDEAEQINRQAQQELNSRRDKEKRYCELQFLQINPSLRSQWLNEKL